MTALTTYPSAWDRMRRHRVPLWMMLVLLAGAIVPAGWAERVAGNAFEDRGKVVHRDYLFEAAGHKRQSYELYVPTGYAKSHPAPLIVLLHGWGSNPWQIIHYVGIVEQAEKRGYIVVAPYGYNAVGGYGNPRPGRSGWPFGAAANSPSKLAELSEKDVLNVLALVQADYSVDPRRIYLMGHSMGGGGALYLGLKHKGKWAALAAMAPAIYSAPAAVADIRSTPIIMVQGQLDMFVKAQNTRLWVSEMKKLKMDYEYIEIKGGDHFLSIIINPAMIAQVFDFFDQHPKLLPRRALYTSPCP